MKHKSYIKNIAILLCLLVISIPIALAEEFNRVYDANGNLISDGKYYREYNGLNQLVRVRLGNTSSSPLLEEYRWHPIEERIVTKRIFSNGVYNYTVHYPNKNIIVVVNSSGTFYEKYIYQYGILVAQVNADSQKQAVHSDHEGSNTLITDSTGAVVENTFYSPYGEILEGGKSSRYGYEGKEFDSVVQDYDFGFRKYNPDPPIFTQPDTLIQNVYDPQSLNRYTFERNNPYKYVDPDGHYAWLYQLATAAIRWATNYIQNIHISIPRGKAVRETVTESYKELSEKYEEYKREKQVKEILAISDNAALSVKASTTEDKPKIGEFKSPFLDEEEDEEDDELPNIKIKKDDDDTLPNANDLVKQIEKIEEKSKSSGGGGGGSSSGGSSGREIPCKLNCNPKTCKATGDAKCPD